MRALHTSSRLPRSGNAALAGGALVQAALGIEFVFAGLNKAKWSELSMRLLDSGDVSDHPYQTQFEAFFAALNRGEEMPLTSLNQAMKSHQVIFAADQSAATDCA